MLLLPREHPSCVGHKKKGNIDKELRSAIGIYMHVRFLTFQLKVELEMSAWQTLVCQDVFNHSSETQISQWGGGGGSSGRCLCISVWLVKIS